MPKIPIFQLKQVLHMLEKYLDIQDCLEKSCKIRYTLKSTLKTLLSLEKSFYHLQEDSIAFLET